LTIAEGVRANKESAVAQRHNAAMKNGFALYRSTRNPLKKAETKNPTEETVNTKPVTV
jgi:hypothetical protein